MSRFQGSAFRCDKITLLEAIEGIPDKDYNYFFWERQVLQSLQETTS